MDKRYVSFDTSLGTNGLGVPSVDVYFSYCDKKNKTGSFCGSCQNTHLQKDGVGYLLSLDEVLEIIERKFSFMYQIYGKCKVAIMGGEPTAEINLPMGQAIAERYNTIIYTWREREQLKDIDTHNFNKIVCGEYIEELNIGDEYAFGSTNQYVCNNKLEIIKEYKERI